MIELKAYSGEDIQDLIDNGDKIDLEYLNKQFVEKAEADKVIAELKEKLNNSRNARKYWRKEYLIEYKENIHHKYKRCLKMAMWCNERIVRIETDYAFWRYGKYYAQNFYKKWELRWLELAEKFRDNEA